MRLFGKYLAALAFVATTTVIRGQAQTWQSQDVGAVGAIGSTSYDAALGAFTVAGSGADIYGTADEFQFAWQSLTGDGQIIARVGTLQNTNSWAKAGVMIRESLAPNAANAMAVLSSTSGADFQRRNKTAAGTIYQTILKGRAAPQWLKLIRKGNTFSAYLSVDGVAWGAARQRHLHHVPDHLCGLGGLQP